MQMAPALVPVSRANSRSESLFLSKGHTDKVRGLGRPTPPKVIREGPGLLPLTILGTIVRVVELPARRAEVGGFRMINPEYLVGARFLRPSKIEVTFADGLFTLDIKSLGMPVDRIRWRTVAASPAGEAMTVRGKRGDEIHIDSATVRYLVDERYAAKVDATLKELQFSREELRELARDNPPPPEWFNEPERDLARDPWK